MFFVRPRQHVRLEIWPTFVDALSTVLMTIIFVMMIFLVSQVFLVETINDRDSELAALQAKLRAHEDSLEESQKEYQAATLKITELQELIKSLNSKLAKLTQDVTLEKQQNEDLIKTNKRLQIDLEDLQKRLAQIQGMLNAAQQEVIEKDENIKRLRFTINDLEKEQEKHQDAIRVGQFRSEFFAQLQKILGNRNDVRVVGDRFVFQSEVLFDVGSAELGTEGKKSLDGLIKALKEIGNKIPSHIHWILRVDGHTDKRPIKNNLFSSNWELSTARAIAVVKYMIEKSIDGKHLVAAGFGEFQPLSEEGSNDLDKDRRIEFKLDQR